MTERAAAKGHSMRIAFATATVDRGPLEVELRVELYISDHVEELHDLIDTAIRSALLEFPRYHVADENQINDLAVAWEVERRAKTIWPGRAYRISVAHVRSGKRYRVDLEQSAAFVVVPRDFFTRDTLDLGDA